MMSRSPRFSLFRRFRKSRNLISPFPWKPAVATGVGGAAFAVWFEEILLLAGEFLGLIFLPILAGVIYIFNLLIFKSHMPNREDLANHTTKKRK
jgi:hypothetical protein